MHVTLYQTYRYVAAFAGPKVCYTMGGRSLRRFRQAARIPSLEGMLKGLACIPTRADKGCKSQRHSISLHPNSPFLKNFPLFFVLLLLLLLLPMKRVVPPLHPPSFTSLASHTSLTSYYFVLLRSLRMLRPLRSLRCGAMKTSPRCVSNLRSVRRLRDEHAWRICRAQIFCVTAVKFCHLPPWNYCIYGFFLLSL